MAHSTAVKQAAMGRLILGEAPGRVARDLGLPYSTVKRWQGVAWSQFGGNGHKKEAPSDLGEGVAAWLGESLATGSALLNELSDPERLRQMGAKDLAMMHGSLFDQSTRLLGGTQAGPVLNAR